MKREQNKLDIIVPISLEPDWPTVENTVNEILLQNRRYGITRFTLFAPGNGWRSCGVPPMEHYIDKAKMFLRIKEALAPYGIECGWTVSLTVKTGPSPEFSRMIDMNGNETPISSCPSDPAFRRIFAERVATFAKIAKPAFIFTEDDFSIMQTAKRFGCFCPIHLSEFARRVGKRYTREELVELFSGNTGEGLALLRRWCELMRDSLVGLASEIRKELDKDSPEIPMGTMQSGNADEEGDCTEAVARAMAGRNHTPFSRLYGTCYCGGDSKNFPTVLYHPLYTKQHVKGDFRFYHESDSFPHMKYFLSATQMRIIMSMAYFYGFDGSVFQTQQVLDDPNEEDAFGSMYKRNTRVFNAVYKAARKCELRGVSIGYDPFYNTKDKSVSTKNPLWVKCVSLFGIPYTTTDSDVAFWDVRQARYSDDAEIMRRLSRGLFLDGAAARVLCERGYGEYLGVRVTEGTIEDPYARYDIDAREIIRDGFAKSSKGRNMASPHLYVNGENGNMTSITVTDPHCKILSDLYSFRREKLTPAVTAFENRLGGRVAVMGMTLDGNYSPSLFNYRRQRLFRELVLWLGADLAFVEEEPSIFTAMNEAKNPEEDGFFGMLIMINLSEDETDRIKIRLPEKWREREEIRYLDKKGEWLPLRFKRTKDGISLSRTLKYAEPFYIAVI